MTFWYKQRSFYEEKYLHTSSTEYSRRILGQNFRILRDMWSICSVFFGYCSFMTHLSTLKKKQRSFYEETYLHTSSTEYSRRILRQSFRILRYVRNLPRFVKHLLSVVRVLQLHDAPFERRSGTRRDLFYSRALHI